MCSQLSQVDFGHDKFVMRVALVHNTHYFTAVTNPMLDIRESCSPFSMSCFCCCCCCCRYCALMVRSSVECSSQYRQTATTAAAAAASSSYWRSFTFRSVLIITTLLCKWPLCKTHIMLFSASNEPIPVELHAC